MNIAIDYDNTWTTDPQLWAHFARSAKHWYHRVVIVTGRDGWSEDMDRGNIPRGIPVVFCSGRPKREAVGMKIDVWIDDDPASIIGRINETGGDEAL